MGEAGAATKAIRSYTSILSPRPARALCLSLSLWTLVWAPRCPCAHANEGPVCSELRVRYLRVRVMRGLLIEQREGGRHTCHESSPSNPKHAYFTVFLKK